MFGPDLIESMFRASGGVEVECEGRTTWGHLDAPGEELGLGDASFRGVDRVVTVAAELCPAVQGGSITVDGTAYVVRTTWPKDEGAELVIGLGQAQQ